MDKIKHVLSERGIGFYILCGSILLSIISIFVYIGNYSKEGEISLNMMSWEAVAFLIIGITGSLILLFYKKTSFWAPIVLATFNYAAMLLYVITVYMYIAIAAVGIDISTVSNKFIATTTLIVLSAVTSIVAVFFKQMKTSIA